MPRTPPFDMLRACFWLLAGIIALSMIETAVAVGGCVVLVVWGSNPMGACQGVGDQARGIWAEAMATVLALLLAHRGGTPPAPPAGGQETPP